MGNPVSDWQHEVMELPVLLYDGDCAFCSSSARFVERRIPTTASIRAWQFADLEALGVTQAEAEDAIQWVTSPNDHTAGPEALADLLRSSRPWWRLVGLILGLRPVLWVAWPAYRAVSRNRHRLPGGTATCSLPQAERERRKDT